MKRSKKHMTKGLLTTAVLVPFLSTTLARAYTTDITKTVAPSQKTTSGDAAHPTENTDSSGAAIYSIPLPSSPNRGGMVPQLALTYSSKNPIRGGIAMGWSLALPSISVDTSDGRLGNLNYTSSIGGRLIRSTDLVEEGWEAYRAQEDSSYTRYERHAIGSVEWRARTTDGKTLYFGQTFESKDTPHLRSDNALEGRLFLTKEVDRFGNEIVYHYTKVQATATEGIDTIPADIAIDYIEYGANANAGLSHHAKIKFQYAAQFDTCDTSKVPVGAQFDFRTGFPTYKGAKRLNAVVLEVKDSVGAFQERKRLSLSYDMNELACTMGEMHTPLRILTSVQESAVSPTGVVSQKPPVTFTYNRTERMFDQEKSSSISIPSGSHADDNFRDTRYSTLVDVNGDGLVDGLSLTGSVRYDGGSSDPYYCTADWSPNLGDSIGTPTPFGISVADRSTPVLPTIPWKGSTRDNNREHCSIDHQLSNVENYSVYDPDGTYCEVNFPLQPPIQFQPRSEAHQIYQFRDMDGDGLIDIATQIESNTASYQPWLDSRVGPDLSNCNASTCNGTWISGYGCDNTPPGNDPQPSDNQCTFRSPEVACGQYVYRVYRNLGNGLFASGVAWPASVPLEEDSTPYDDSFGLLHSLVADIDGDGATDTVSFASDKYWLRQGILGGGFSDTTRMWNLPELCHNNAAGVLVCGEGFPSFTFSEVVWGLDPGHPCQNHDPEGDPCNLAEIGNRSITLASLEDINGDGLSDYVDSRNGLRVYYNTGAGFERYQHLALNNRGTQLSTVSDLVLSKSIILHIQPNNDDRTGQLIRMVDIDSDGLQDLVVQDKDDVRAFLYLNLQDRFVYVGESSKLNTVADMIIQRQDLDKTFHIKTDFLDVTGDGLPEGIVQHGGSKITGDSDPEPMRLLKEVNTGTGLKISYSYEIVNGTPSPITVVREVDVNPGPDADGLAQASSITLYQYEDPAYNRDFTGNWGFRGFGTTTVASPSGAVKTTLRDFTQYYGGLVTEERLEDEVLSSGLPHFSSISRSTYTRDELPSAEAVTAPSYFGGIDLADPSFTAENDLVSFHKRTETIRTCGATQDYDACWADGALRYELQNWVPVQHNQGSNSIPNNLLPAVAFLQESLWVSSALLIIPGTQVDGFSYYVRSNEAEYRILPKEEAHYVFNPSQTIVKRKIRYYDTNLMVNFWLTELENTNPLTYAVTSFSYDMQTGNQLGTKKPIYFTALGPWEGNTLDARRVFPVQSSNALGFTVDYTYDLATGAKLSTRGPNSKSCGSGCTIKDGSTRTIDGFGRPLTENVYIDDAILGYRPVEVARYSYQDAATPLVSVITENLIDYDDKRWVANKSEADGLRRIIKETSYEGITPKTVSKYFYDIDGKLWLAQTPKPSANSLSTVPWYFDYDALGREVLSVRPDGTSTEKSYDGLTKTQTEIPADLGGEIAISRVTGDIFGRAVKVEEALDTGTWAATLYQYDGNSNVSRIESPDGIVTTMVHNALSRRMSINKGGQTWSYSYDQNGNMTGIVSPYPVGANAADYSTTIAYDVLDRPTSRISGDRSLSRAEKELFGPSTIEYTYDLNDNGKGRLSKTTQPALRSDFYYDALGRQVKGIQSFNISIGASYEDRRTTIAEYNAMGQPRWITLADDAGTKLSFKYGTRGLPESLYQEGSINMALMRVTRTSLGLVSTREQLDSNGLASTQELFSYDDLGRIINQRVTSRAAGETNLSTRAEQTIAYTGTGDVDSIQTTLNNNHLPATYYDWSFGYDNRHQLTSAVGPLGYQGVFGYTNDGRISYANVSADPAAVRVPNREVQYEYQTGDPEAPKVLRSADGSSWMNIAYDLSGNATERTINGSTWNHTYDGADLQRQVINPDGSKELYWYDANRQRALVATLDISGQVERIRWNVGPTELWYNDAGQVEKTVSVAALGSSLVRIEDGQARGVFQDARGDILVSTDQESGELLAGFSYGPFGEVLEQIGADNEEYLERFNGKEFDETSGLSYYGYRYYDDHSLVWTQADPLYRFAPDIALGAPRRMKTYAFTLNNPMRFVDPDGLAPNVVINDVTPEDCPAQDTSCIPEEQAPTPTDSEDTSSLELSLPSVGNHVSGPTVDGTVYETGGGNKILNISHDINNKETKIGLLSHTIGEEEILDTEHVDASIESTVDILTVDAKNKNLNIFELTSSINTKIGSTDVKISGTLGFGISKRKIKLGISTDLEISSNKKTNSLIGRALDINTFMNPVSNFFFYKDLATEIF
jgi:RHS repeat-associated protein